MRLYDRPTSGNSYKIRLLLSILRIDYQTIPVAVEGGRNTVDAAYLALNPRGQIPTLDDDGLLLWGSTAILFYIASRYDSRRQWLPVDLQKSAMVMQWLEFAQNECNTGLFLARAIRRFGYAGDLSAARRDGEKALKILESRLERHDWLAGADPTIADIACFPYAALGGEGGFDLSSRPAVRRWIARIIALDGFVGMPGIPVSETTQSSPPNLVPMLVAPRSISRFSARSIQILFTTACCWVKRSQQRHELSQLNDRMLRDCGLDRYIANNERRKPFWMA
jgi:glutathione S-transferase